MKIGRYAYKGKCKQTILFFDRPNFPDGNTRQAFVFPRHHGFIDDIKDKLIDSFVNVGESSSLYDQILTNLISWSCAILQTLILALVILV